MKIYSGFKDKRIKPKARSLAIGIFDGVHRGHQKIIFQALKNSKRRRAGSMVITFEPHPSKILKSQKDQPILMSLTHRLRFFKKMGIEEAMVIRFNKSFSKIPHDSFLNEILFKKLGMRSLSVGKDFRFGFQGKGDSKFLSSESKRAGFQLSLAQPLKYQGQIISSTRIRKLIEKGDLKKAGRMLGRPVSVYGTVVRGRGRGKSIGFPTANLDPHHETLPPNGVYAAWGFLNQRKLKGVIHIGKRPTFNDREKSLEVHFFDFHKNIYGSEVELFFIKRLRAIKKYKNPKALIRAIQNDTRKALKIL